MKRSFINQKIEEGIVFLKEHRFYLPPWFYWTPAQWSQAGHEADEIRERMLGWDITDFGHDNYARLGLLMLTIRNGRLTEGFEPLVKNYCEKILLVDEEQVTPTHFHWYKMEDIINRGGGNLLLQLWQADGNEGLDQQASLEVSIDGISTKVPAGGYVTLEPGQSITLAPYVYHRFFGEKGKGVVLVGEVSRVNDDTSDNRFLESLPRFPTVEEDEEPRYLLCTEYPQAQ
jgi:hypothetical protein